MPPVGASENTRFAAIRWAASNIGEAPAKDETISTHELRFQFSRVLSAVRAGRSLTLTYRNHPLARIVPLDSGAAPAADDPIFRLHELAEPIGPMTNTEIDRAIYGE